MALPKGENNCITDVQGVKVGHVTLYDKLNNRDVICTGVTAILPHGGNLFQEKVPAGCAVLNGFGKSIGLVQINELGRIESPIMLTNTNSVGSVFHGTLQYLLEQNKDIGDATSTVNIVVGECNDGYLNSIRHLAVKPEHAIEAIHKAATEPAEEGAVGAGKGMVAFGYKGGIGTSSRVISNKGHTFTLGCFVLSNYGKPEHALFANLEHEAKGTPEGSIMMVIATDAPLYDRQLRRLANRCAAGLGRTGSILENGSGDIAIAFSTANRSSHYSNHPIETLSYIRDDHPLMNKLFQAVVETTEEAVIRSLRKAETTEGRLGRVVKKAPL